LFFEYSRRGSVKMEARVLQRLRPPRKEGAARKVLALPGVDASDQGQPAIDDDCLARHIAGLIRGQIGHGRRQFLRLA